MKNILIILAISLGIMSVNAQTRTIDLAETTKAGVRLNLTNGNTYFKDTQNQTSTFIGTWVWKSGAKEFTLTLMQQNKFPNKNARNEIRFYVDRLAGYYVYKENGKIVASTETDNLEQNYPKVYFSWTGNDATGRIKDYLKNKSYTSSLEKVSAGKIKLTMQKEESVNTIFPDTDKSTLPKPGNTFPLTMELTKVK